MVSDVLVVLRAVDEWRRLGDALEGRVVPCQSSPMAEAWWEKDLADEAKALCRQCPVRKRCLEYALAADERYGVWGARDPDERRAVRRRA